MKLKIKLLAICALIFAVFSCTDFSMSTSRNYSADSPAQGKVKLCGTITMPEFDGAVPSVTVKIKDNGIYDAEERSAAFTPINYNDSDYQYFAEAKKRDSNDPPVSDANFEGTYPDKTFTLVLDYGYWDITAGIKKDNQIIFSDTQSVELKTGEPTQYSANFTIKPQITENGSGEIDLEMTKTNDLECVTAHLILYDDDTRVNWVNAMSDIDLIESERMTISNNIVSLKTGSTKIKSGSYLVKFVFYDYDDYGKQNAQSLTNAISDGLAIPVYSTIQTINVYDNLTTNYWVKSADVPQIEPINADGTFGLTSAIINSYNLTDIHVSQNGQDSNSGSVYNPFKTFNQAVRYINERGDSNTDYSITVNGEIKGLAKIDLGDGKAKSLKIKGKNSDQSDKLNGDQKGSAVTIDTAVPVTFENITITGGSGTTISGGTSGGGLYIENGTVKLGDGLRITGNHATGSGKGGGVYVAPGAKLYMYGESLIGNSITDNTTPEDAGTCSANYAYGDGAGIYNEGETYIGYTIEGETLKTKDIAENYGIRNNWTNGSGGAVYNTGTLHIASGTCTHNQVGQYGGAFYVKGNNATISMTGGKIDSNKAVFGGALCFDGKTGESAIISAGTIENNEATFLGGAIYVALGKKVKFSGGTISKNKATGTVDRGYGGGVYIACSSGANTETKGTFEMTGGKLEGNTSSIGKGGAVYNAGNFIVSGTASIPYGADNTTGAGKNDVYLWDLSDSTLNRTITVDTFASNAPATVATITLAEWKRGRKILTSSSAISDTVKSKFALSLNDSDWTKKTASDNKSVIITSPVYVVGAQNSGSTRPDTSWGWGNTSANGAIGTKSKPFSTIEDAINLLNGDSTLEQKVVIAGTVKGNQTTGSTVNASSITIEGYNANATLNGNTNGSTLTIGAAKTFVIQQLQITGGKASAGGGIYLSAGSVELADNAIVKGNTATSSGGGVYVSNGTTLTISSGSVQGNSAPNGGGVYVDYANNNSYGTLTMTSGTIGVNGELNSASGSGAAVYNKGKFNISGSAVVNSGNDIYLPEGKLVTVPSSFTGSAKITPGKWVRGIQVLDGDYGTTYASKFSVSDSDWKVCTTTDGSAYAGKIDTTDQTIYVSQVSYSNTAGYSAGSDTSGQGTKKKPYLTVTTAAKQTWKAQSYTIEMNGTFDMQYTSYLHTIPNDDAVKATSITLSGNNNAKLNNKTSSRALTISKAVPVTIQNITITTDSSVSSYPGYGGGIYCSVADASLTLGTGAVITGNTAQYSGGGIYCAGTDGHPATLKMNSTAKVVGNSTTTSTTGGGGGVYLQYANLCMSGSALIGEGGSASATSTSGKYSNKSILGGGVYIATGGAVWLGYKAASDNDASKETLSTGYGIRYNYATTDGGGIYNKDGNVYVSTGDVLYNYAINSGGGVWNAKSVAVKGGAIKGNNAGQYGGGVYSTASFAMSGGVIGDDSGSYIAKTEVANHSNSATWGGGLYLSSTSSSYIQITGGSIEYNWASYGGGIYVACNHMTIKGCNVERNGALKGGGVYASDNNVHLWNDTFTSNKADDSGGAVYFAATSSQDQHMSLVFQGTTTISSTQVKNNDVYLKHNASPARYARISAYTTGMDGALTSEGPVATITPDSYEDNLQVGAFTINNISAKAEIKKFRVTPEASQNWSITETGKLKKQ
ncbi:beta strand repeat-containing protein [Treponema sp.]|uniref:beta strand repeat-containing protein n=1 Tax=Treponema sp. TaxID=166 RepID=UPI00388D8702